MRKLLFSFLVFIKNSEISLYAVFKEGKLTVLKPLREIKPLQYSLRFIFSTSTLLLLKDKFIINNKKIN